jgi:hypothetical protein
VKLCEIDDTEQTSYAEKEKSCDGSQEGLIIRSCKPVMIQKLAHVGKNHDGFWISEEGSDLSFVVVLVARG